jgi:hypothetical protein
MLSRRVATVSEIDGEDSAVQLIYTEYGPAWSFIELTGKLSEGDQVLVNRTAVDMALGTGGYDFVISRLNPLPESTGPASREQGHILKLRYTPMQHSRLHLEEVPEHAHVWDKSLDTMPVICAELHSQIAPILMAAKMRRLKCVYVMTSGGALAAAVSNLIVDLRTAGLIETIITPGHAFGGTAETLTLHNALLAAKHVFNADMAVVSQGPGNAGSATKYGFSGIEQASAVDIASTLGGRPVVCVRASVADKRDRHFGISHHTVTVIETLHSRATIALPIGLKPIKGWLKTHQIAEIRTDTEQVISELKRTGVTVTTMGRTLDEDRLFFECSAAAGLAAAEMVMPLAQTSDALETDTESEIECLRS